MRTVGPAIDDIAQRKPTNSNNNSIKQTGNKLQGWSNHQKKRKQTNCLNEDKKNTRKKTQALNYKEYTVEMKQYYNW